jgi:hypothetical protein
MALRNDRFPTDVETLDMLEIPLRANLRIGRIAWPLLEFDVLGLKKLTSSSSQVRHVTRLSGNFSIAKAQRAVRVSSRSRSPLYATRRVRPTVEWG